MRTKLKLNNIDEKNTNRPSTSTGLNSYSDFLSKVDTRKAIQETMRGTKDILKMISGNQNKSNYQQDFRYLFFKIYKLLVIIKNHIRLLLIIHQGHLQLKE